MKHTWTLVALVAATACVSPEAHRRVTGANAALQAEIAGMAESQRALSAENERLRNENLELGKRAADATWIDEQKKRINELLAKYSKGGESSIPGVSFVNTPGGYAFRVEGSLLFSSGSNELSKEGKSTLEELAKTLRGRKIRIEGHTDDQPIDRSRWGTNLRLSVERSMAVADYLTKSARLEAALLSVAGYGEFMPAVAGSDDAARAANRRVEILLLDP